MASQFYLEFEKPIVELEKKIDELNLLSNSGLDLKADVAALESRVEEMRESVFANLSRWQTAQVARHINRPFTLDYINLMFTEFTQLHGDRNYGDDHAIVGGLARFDGQPVMVIGHQKGLPQLRHAQPGRLPQGAAPDEDGRAVQAAGNHFC